MYVLYLDQTGCQPSSTARTGSTCYMVLMWNQAGHHFCNTPPHFAGSLQTAAKCSYTKVGACKDGIVWLQLCIVLLCSKQGMMTCMTACDVGVMASKWLPCCNAFTTPRTMWCPLDGPQNEDQIGSLTVEAWGDGVR